MQPSQYRDRPARRFGSAARAGALLYGVSAGVLGLTTLTGCTSGGDTGNALAGGKSAEGTSTVATAPPGKYQELPQPCKTVARGTLKSLLPGSDDYAGKAALTYDTDRRVGCTWSTSSAGDKGGSRYLTIDLERVVSYDPTVSDESAAEQEYDAKAIAAGIPSAASSPTASGSPSASPTRVTAPSSSPTSPSDSTDDSTDSSIDGSAAAPGSRALTDLGGNAYLDDVLSTRDSGVHRDITIVFREANVLITIEFSQSSADKTITPGSAPLQAGAQRVAREIAHQFD